MAKEVWQSIPHNNIQYDDQISSHGEFQDKHMGVCLSVYFGVLSFFSLHFRGFMVIFLFA